MSQCSPTVSRTCITVARPPRSAVSLTDNLALGVLWVAAALGSPVLHATRKWLLHVAKTRRGHLVRHSLHLIRLGAELAFSVTSELRVTFEPPSLRLVRQHDVVATPATSAAVDARRVEVLHVAVWDH